MVNRKIICRLCLKKCGEHFKFIEENAKELLGILLLKIDLAISKTPVICKNCAETLKKCFDFKSACLYLQGYIVTLINTNDDTKQNLKIVYVGKKSNTDILENENVCQFCAGVLQSSCLDNEERYVKEMMLEKCLPEVELNVINISAICTGCHGAVQDYFTFITNCSTVEEKIKKYSEAVGKSCINLNNVLQYISENMCEEVDNKDDIIKIENNSTTSEDGDKIETTKIEIVCEEADNVNKEVDDFVELEDRKSKIENVCEEAENVHKEVDDFVELEDKKSNDMLQCTSENTVTCEDVKVVKTEESFGEEKLDDISHENENYMKMEDQKFLSCINEEIEIKTEPEDFDSLQDGVILPRLGVTRNLQKNTMRQCEYCSYQTKYKACLDVHQLIHNNSLEIRMYQCESCSFQTKYKYVLKRHLLRHKHPSEIPVHKCEICPFEAKFEYRLLKHMLSHKDPSEITMYKCEFCSFKTEYITNLKEHNTIMHEVVTSNDATEKKIYKCEICAFHTKSKFHLKRHTTWSHKDPSERTIFQCDFCSYRTKFKRCLEKHVIGHKNPVETNYPCDLCSFQTKLKPVLRRHLLTHRDPSEVTKYQCDSCSFQTKYKHRLHTHMNRHKNRCELHKNSSEVKMSQCEFCSYQMKQKDSVQAMYQCATCSFRTNFKNYLKVHMLTHRNPSKVKIYNCEVCSFQTKYKFNVRPHMVTHKKRTEVTMHKCDLCSFQTKYLISLKRHIMSHEVLTQNNL